MSGSILPQGLQVDELLSSHGQVLYLFQNITETSSPQWCSPWPDCPTSNNIWVPSHTYDADFLCSALSLTINRHPLGTQTMLSSLWITLFVMVITEFHNLKTLRAWPSWCRNQEGGVSAVATDVYHTNLEWRRSLNHLRTKNVTYLESRQGASSDFPELHNICELGWECQKYLWKRISLCKLKVTF